MLSGLGFSGQSWRGFYSSGYAALQDAALCGSSWDDAWNAAISHHVANPTDEGHWEFLAIGLLHLTDDATVLPSEHAQRLKGVRQRFQHSARTVNWRLMARCVDARLSGRFLVMGDLSDVGLTPAPDGWLPDEPGALSSQYHAYILLLLMRFGDQDDKLLAEIVKDAFVLLYKLWAEYGDPSPIGRGQFQVFGYAAMHACARLGHSWGCPVDGEWLSAVTERCAAEPPWGALSALWTGPHRSHLLHGYNTADDYAEFARLWMGDDAYRAASPPKGPTSWEGPIWWHPIGDGTNGLLANRQGPIFSITHVRSESIGRRALLARLLRGRTHSGDAAALPSCLISCDSIELGRGLEVSVRQNTITFRVSPEAIGTQRVLENLTIWARTAAPPTVRVTGSVEVDSLAWRRTGSEEWNGQSIRVVRKGTLEITWSR